MTSPEEVSVTGPDSWAAAGNGFEVYGDELAGLLAQAGGVFTPARPQAIDLFPLAQADLSLPEKAVRRRRRTPSISGRSPRGNRQ